MKTDKTPLFTEKDATKRAVITSSFELPVTLTLTVPKFVILFLVVRLRMVKSVLLNELLRDPRRRQVRVEVEERKAMS